MNKVASVDEYIITHARYRDLLLTLRETFLFAGLDEAIKWGAPVYMHKGKNLLGMAAFKQHLAVWFFHGSLLADATGALINANKETTNAMRQLRYKVIDDVDFEMLSEFVNQSIENFEKGLFVKPIKNKPILLPDELKGVFLEDKQLELAFNNLNKTLKREFTAYIANAKRESTRMSRLEKVIEHIREGKGLYERYKR